MDEERNWLDLPSDIQALIMEKLISINDRIFFGAVCVSWRSTFVRSLSVIKQVPHPQLPLLMIPYPSSPSATITSTFLHSFYNLSKTRVLDSLQFSTPSYENYVGSSHGWLIIVGNKDTNFSVKLFNPCLCKEIQLPPLTTFVSDDVDDEIRNFAFVGRAVLSVDPISNPDSYVVMVIYGRKSRLGFLKPGYRTWRPLPSQWDVYFDVIYSSGVFFAINYYGKVVAIDVSADCEQPKVTLVARLPIYPHYGVKNIYVVESAGDLLQVNRLYRRHATGSFRVFKPLLGNGIIGGISSCSSKFVPVTDLCGRMLFLGENASMSLLASDFPGCKPNCIYFMDNPSDIKVFNIETDTFEADYPMELNNGTMWTARPIWVEPTIRLNQQQ